MNKLFILFLCLIIFNVDASEWDIDQSYIDEIKEEGMSPTPVDQHGTAITSSSYQCRYDDNSGPVDDRIKLVKHTLLKPGGGTHTMCLPVQFQSKQTPCPQTGKKRYCPTLRAEDCESKSAMNFFTTNAPVSTTVMICLPSAVSIPNSFGISNVASSDSALERECALRES